MKQVHVYVPATYIQGMNRLIGKGRYPHMAELIRIAIRDLLLSEGQWHVRRAGC